MSNELCSSDHRLHPLEFLFRDLLTGLHEPFNGHFGLDTRIMSKESLNTLDRGYQDLVSSND